MNTTQPRLAGALGNNTGVRKYHARTDARSWKHDRGRQGEALVGARSCSLDHRLEAGVLYTRCAPWPFVSVTPCASCCCARDGLDNGGIVRGQPTPAPLLSGTAPCVRSHGEPRRHLQTFHGRSVDMTWIFIRKRSRPDESLPVCNPHATRSYGCEQGKVVCCRPAAKLPVLLQSRPGASSSFGFRLPAQGPPKVGIRPSSKHGPLPNPSPRAINSLACEDAKQTALNPISPFLCRSSQVAKRNHAPLRPLAIALRFRTTHPPPPPHSFPGEAAPPPSPARRRLRRRSRVTVRVSLPLAVGGSQSRDVNFRCGLALKGELPPLPRPRFPDPTDGRPESRPTRRSHFRPGTRGAPCPPIFPHHLCGDQGHSLPVVQSSMASSRKVRNANKRYAKINEDWQDKDETNVNKNKVRKKKLSDMLGSQWSKDELERFYGAYRKYGKDWRKVAGAIRDRSSEMVEALYNMNKAYLSLPEGTATAAGLIAMMTDHYNILDGSNSDRESNDSPKASRKPQKRGRARFQSVSKTPDTRYPDLLQSQPAPSSYGCLSLLKKKRSGDLLVGNRPRAVGKRTPRVPVASMYYRDGRGVADRQARADANNGDDEGAHVAALALAEVCQRGGSPQVSETPRRSGDRMSPSPVKTSDRKNADSEMGSSKLHGFHLDADYPEGSLGSREAETGDYTKGTSLLMKNESSPSSKPQKKVKRSQKGRKKSARKTGDQFEDDREACSGTEEGHRARKAKEDSELEALGWPSSSSNKRSRQLFFGDESSALDALHTLADLSVNILQPSSIVESESSAQIKDENKDNNSDENHGMPEAVSVYEQKVNSKSTAKKVKRQSEISNTEMVTRKKAKLAKDPHHDGSTSSDVKQQACTCSVKIEKKKRKSSTAKALKDERSILKDVEKTEVSAEEGKVSSNKETTIQDETTPQADLPSKGKSRRKVGIQQALTEECKPTKGADDTGSDKFSYSVNYVIDLKDKLSHCLSSRLLRRWCMFEWFYSAIDYPWFAKSEFVEYLNHVKLGHVPRLTRVEWGVIRSSLGKPRRLSKQFLHEEREKLSQYRDSVRQHYAELRSGVREGLPTDLARPLAVGQHVIACHPRTRELHDGKVLTVDSNCCRVQFDRPELGVQFVMDIDCMTLHPMENFPESLRQQNIVNKYLSEVKLEDQMKELGSGDAARFTSNVNVNGADVTFHIPSGHPINTLMKQAKGNTIDSIVQAKATVNEVAVAAQQAMYNQPCSLSQIQEREADIRALAELSRALDKKEALLVELRHMNEEVSGKQKDGETIRDLKHFRTQYAMVLVQLRDSNDQVASALLSLRQRNTYHGNQVQSYPASMENGGAFAGAPDPYNHFGYINPESGSQVIEVIETSRRRAKTMVNVAVQAMCKVSEGENAFAKIGEALDNLNNRGTGSGSSILGIRRIPPDSGHANTSYQDNGMPAPAANNSSGPRLLHGCDSEAQFPTELISSCIATILMIQNCTEKQYHPAEVAHILDSALSRLQPCSSQNIPIFREIEMCMGIIKNQMLALIPTPSG